MIQLRIKNLILILFCIAIFSSCGSSNDSIPSLAITGSSLSPLYNGENMPPSIGVIMLASGTSNAYGKSQYNYVYSNTSGYRPYDDANTAYFPTDKSNVDVLAYSPFCSDYQTNGTIPINISDQSDISKLDLMVTNKTTGLNSDKTSAQLSFNHRLTMVNVDVEKDASLSNIDLNGATIKFIGIPLSAQYNVLTDEITNGSTGDLILPSSFSDGIIKAKGILLPMQYSPLQLAITTVSGKVFKIQQNTSLVEGSNNTLYVKLSQTSANFTITVKPWSTGVTENIPIAIKSVLSGESSGNMTVANGDKLHLKSGTLEADYAYSNSTWSSIAPLYWDSFSSTSNTTFYAIYTPSSTAGPEKDYLSGTSSIAFGEPLSLQLNHVMSQICIILKAGTGFSSNNALLSDMTSRTLMLKALSSLSLITSGNNAGGVTYSLASSYSNISSNLPFVSGTTYTVTPQILTDEAKMVLTSSKGHTYTLKLSDITVNGAKLTALEAGKSYQINVTVNDTAVTINVTCSDWTNINGTGDVTPDK